jgi:hypothetical protein
MPCLVYRWDLDKTYLKTEFDSLRELMKIPFEKAEDKVAAPGVAALIRELRASALRSGRDVRVYFISASPPQIGGAIKRKLDLDGVVYDGIVFKDQLHRIVRGKFRHLREQVGFKLTELLKARCDDPADSTDYLFGDDWESDPLIYSLYADAIAGRVQPEELAGILRALRVDGSLIEEACCLADAAPRGDLVARIFINLERRTPPATFRYYGRRLVPTFNFLQTAACLFEEGVLGLEGVTAVASSLVTESGYSPSRLGNSLADIERRGHLSKPSAIILLRHLEQEKLLPGMAVFRFGRWRSLWLRLGARRRIERARRLATESMAPIDYASLIAKQQADASEAEEQ